MKFNNIEKLQNYVLESLEKLDKRKIDVDEMSIIAKSSETVIASLKIQLAYNNMRGEMPNIKFLEDCNEGIIINSPVKAIR